MAFERIDSKEVWSGKIATVRVDRVRYDDGEEADREAVDHPGAVAVVAHDDEVVYLVAQPREAVDEQSLVELPAGKLDEEGEEPLDTAKRELAEEIGKGANTWKHLATFYSSPGFSNEEIHLYLATDLYDQTAEGDPRQLEVGRVAGLQLGGEDRGERAARVPPHRDRRLRPQAGRREPQRRADPVERLAALDVRADERRVRPLVVGRRDGPGSDQTHRALEAWRH